MKLNNKYITKDKTNRLYKLAKPIIAITGGIGTGKSSTCQYIKDKLNVEIIDADKLIKNIYQYQQTLELLKESAPLVIGDRDQINFKLLRQQFFTDQKLKKKMEVHLFRFLEQEFIKQANLQEQEFIIYEVPLLFEKSIHKLVDVNILVYAPEPIQIARIVKRDQSTNEQAKRIIENQMPIDNKKRLAQFIIDNSGDSLNKLAIDQLIKLIFTE